MVKGELIKCDTKKTGHVGLGELRMEPVECLKSASQKTGPLLRTTMFTTELMLIRDGDKEKKTPELSGRVISPQLSQAEDCQYVCPFHLIRSSSISLTPIKYYL